MTDADRQAVVNEAYATTYNAGLEDAADLFDIIVKISVDKMQTAFAQLPERPVFEPTLIIALDQLAIEYRKAIEAVKLTAEDMAKARKRLNSNDNLTVDKP